MRPSQCRAFAFAVLLLVTVLSTHFAAGEASACSLNCPAGDNVVGPPPSNHSPDLNSDGIVNLVDLAMFATSWPPGPYNPCMDYNCDGIINLIDLVTFAQHWFHTGVVAGFCIP